MINIDTLDTVIAIVIVILVLSLIVQSVQSFLKKVFKYKSRHLEDSLVDLFRNAIDGPGETPENRLMRSPVVRAIFRRAHPAEKASEEVRQLYNLVISGLKETGRVSQWGNLMLDSISKGDLLKILREVTPKYLLPTLPDQLKNVCSNVIALKAAVEATKTINLSGDASAKFVAMQEALAPLLSNLNCIFDEKGQGLKENLALGDVLELREINLNEVIKLLGDVQEKVAADLEHALTTNAAAVSELQELAQQLKNIAAAITNLRQSYDTALAPFRIKLKEVESWYETVMQSFEERYARGMKTWAVVISFVVVVFLNANFFNIYRNISANDVMRNLMVQKGQETLDRSRQSTATTPPLPAAPSPAPSPAPTTAQTTTASAPATPTGTATTTAQAQDAATSEQLKKELADVRKAVESDVDLYSGFGFATLGWGQFREWLATLPAPLAVGENGQVYRRWDLWREYRKHDFVVLVGWIITTLLLSVGAPFWQDTLESLFGVKNLLRKSTGTRNVEEEKGAGQPKP
jgi:hypothetical protein